jgi:hypothetical protein
MKISDIIEDLSKILMEEGDLPVYTKADPYGYNNLWGMPIESVVVEENPENIVDVPRYRNPNYRYKGKVVFL